MAWALSARRSRRWKPRLRRAGAGGPEGQGLATGSTVEATETGEAAAALIGVAKRVPQGFSEGSQLPVFHLKAVEVAELMTCFAVGGFRASLTKP